MIGNHLLQHRELSATAIGIAGHIQSLPGGAPVGIRALMDRFPEGEKRISAALRELERCGYLERRTERLATGRVVTRTYSYNKPRTGPDEPPPPPPPPPPSRSEPASAPAPDAAPAPCPDADADPGPGADPALTADPTPDPAPCPCSAPDRERTPTPDADPAPAPGPAPGPDADREPTPTPDPTPDPALCPDADRESHSGPSPDCGPSTDSGPSRDPAREPAAGVDPGGSPGHGTGWGPVSGSWPAPRHLHPGAADLLAGLRHLDPRLLLAARDVERLAPGVAAWLDRGADPEAVGLALTTNLPEPMRSPAAVLAYRLKELLPPHLPQASASKPVRRPDPFQTCDGCERAFRSPYPGRCRDCPPPPAVAA
ncbi:helix-turn-helix domain-containing protein [Streptomyces sp. NPDC086989]|uniref:helix-turn-helix domain-containing protein n=1 Tax=Streptomyces sp. NPDC086989 TaxID=3365764 RepID=UPI003821CC8C